MNQLTQFLDSISKGAANVVGALNPPRPAPAAAPVAAGAAPSKLPLIIGIVAGVAFLAILVMSVRKSS